MSGKECNPAMAGLHENGNMRRSGTGISIQIAKSAEEKAEILRLRELVYVQEQERLLHVSDVEENVFGEFEPFSTYFIAYAGNTAVGTIRVIADSAAGLPCERNASLESLRPCSKLVEFGHFISLPEFRFKGLGLLLLQEAFGFSVVCLHATHILADIFADDTSVLGPKYFLSRGFRQIGELYSDQRFNGSPRSMVVALDVQEGMKLRERSMAVDAYRRRILQDP